MKKSMKKECPVCFAQSGMPCTMISKKSKKRVDMKKVHSVRGKFSVPKMSYGFSPKTKRHIRNRVIEIARIGGLGITAARVKRGEFTPGDRLALLMSAELENLKIQGMNVAQFLKELSLMYNISAIASGRVTPFMEALALQEPKSLRLKRLQKMVD